MLVLTRKNDETICIGNNVTLRVLEIKGDKVRLGFDAPLDVPIVRGELLEADETAAADVPPADLQPAA